MNEVKKSHFQFGQEDESNFFCREEILLLQNSVELVRVFHICVKLFDLKQFSVWTAVENKNMEEKGWILALF